MEDHKDKGSDGLNGSNSSGSGSTSRSDSASGHSTILRISTPLSRRSTSSSLGDGSVSSYKTEGDAYYKIVETLRKIEDEEKADLKIGIEQKPGSRHATFSPQPSPPLSPNPNNFKFTKTINKAVPSSNMILCSSMTFECTTTHPPSSSTSSTPRLPRINNSTGCSAPPSGRSVLQGYFSTSAPSIPLENGQGDTGICDISDPFRSQPISARSYSDDPIKHVVIDPRPSSALGCAGSRSVWYPPPNTDKARDIFSFLDEVEKVDRENLFHLKFSKTNPPKSSAESGAAGSSKSRSSAASSALHGYGGLDGLSTKAPSELAQEVFLLERKLDEYKHQISVLEDTIANQRELNIRHIKQSERDLKKRLRLQQEEFDLALTRHQAFVDQVISEKRLLQEKCEKLLRDFKESEQRHQDVMKSVQEKHLEELKRIRRMHESSDKAKKAQWLGVKSQEIRETTIKGLEPQLQRVIKRHQSEMAEMRAWHENELQDLEDRCSRKFAQQAKEIREQMVQEMESDFSRERETLKRRHETELANLRSDFDTQKNQYLQQLHAMEQRNIAEQVRSQESLRDQLKAAESKHRIDIDAMKQECENKLLNLQNQHIAELANLKSSHDAELETQASAYNQKLESALKEKEATLFKRHSEEKSQACQDSERKFKQELQKQATELESQYESKTKRQQEKWNQELEQMERTEQDLKQKLSLLKGQLMSKEDEIFSLKALLSSKEKYLTDLAEGNSQMQQERSNLTAVIRKEFESQIESLEQNCLQVKSTILEIKTKHRIQEEQQILAMEKLKGEKDADLQALGQRVVQAMTRKDETIAELQCQLENASSRIQHLEDLLEQQRNEFVRNIPAPAPVKSATKSTSKHK